jgi:polyhydroxybutyrate depolymerase
VIHIHGTADRSIPLDGSPGQGFARIDGPPIPDVVAGWRAVDGCAAPTSTTAGAVTTSVATCPGGRAVELVTIDGAGHQWPGSTPKRLGRLLGLDPPSTALDATAVIWAFFSEHPKGG